MRRGESDASSVRPRPGTDFPLSSLSAGVLKNEKSGQAKGPACLRLSTKI